MAADDSMLHCCVCQKLLSEPPLLLDCFHNCCEKCADSIADNEKTKFTCPLCTQATMVSDAKLNYFVTAQVRAFKVSSGHLECEMCMSKSIENPPEAEDFCSTCWQTLCEECDRDHCKFKGDHATIAIERDLSTSRLCFSAPPFCQLHRKVSKYVCTTCEKTKCTTCLQVCLEGEHTVDVSHGRRARDFVSTIKQLIVDRQRDLQGKTAVFDQLKAVSKDIEIERSSILAHLIRTKQAIVSTVEDVYENAVTRLEESSSSMMLKAESLEIDAEKLAQRSSHLLRCSEKLLQDADIISLLDQQRCLLSAMQCLSEELGRTKAPPVKASQFWRVDGSVPTNLKEIIMQWIGLPHLTVDLHTYNDGDSKDISAVEAVGESFKPDSMGITSSLYLGSSMPADSCDSTQNSLSFDTISTSFRTTTSCYDMATTHDCHLLLALGEHGLHECDLSGKTLAIWKPDKKKYNGDNDSIEAVDTLEDGHAVVGLRHLWWLVFLQCKQSGGSVSWQVNRNITLLTAHPKHLSAQSDMLAVAEFPSTLVLISFKSHSEVVLRSDLDYYISAVALSDHLVITASSAPVPLDGGQKLHVVDAYDHRGERLWRQASNDWVQDIAVTPSSHLLFLAMYSSKRVAAAMKKDGSYVTDVLCHGSHVLQNPLRISLDKAKGLVLALLSGDAKSVCVFNLNLS